MKSIYCNSVEVSHTREAFLLIFRFVAPDGKEESIYITISPSGAVAVHDILEKEIESYIKNYGNIIVGDWLLDRGKENKSGNATTYLT